MKSYKEFIFEASYVGNVGIMELIKFHQVATKQQSDQIKDHIKNNEHAKAWDLVQRVTKMKLHRDSLK